MPYLEGEKSQRTYKLNRNSTVTVKTEMKGDVYTHEIILSIKQASMEPLRFTDKSQIAKLIEDADLEDPQTDLFSGEEDDNPPANIAKGKVGSGGKVE